MQENPQSKETRNLYPLTLNTLSVPIKRFHLVSIYRTCNSVVGGDSLALHSSSECRCASLMTNQLVQCFSFLWSKWNVPDLRPPQQKYFMFQHPQLLKAVLLYALFTNFLRLSLKAQCHSLPRVNLNFKFRSYTSYTLLFLSVVIIYGNCLNSVQLFNAVLLRTDFYRNVTWKQSI